jgi:hypothetical protein
MQMFQSEDDLNVVPPILLNLPHVHNSNEYFTCAVFLPFGLQVVNDLLRKWVESIQSQGALSPALHKASAPVTREHLFVVEYSQHTLWEKQVSVRIKGHQGFLREWWDSIIEMFSKQRLRTRVISSSLEEFSD